MKQVLPTKVKRFIVKMNAYGDSPSEVVRAVAQEFSLDVTPQIVQRYDPTKVPGETLSKVLRELFYATRKAFCESPDTLPMAQKAIRLQRLDAIHEKASEAGTLKIAATAIDLARKEMMGLQLGDGEGITGVFRVINSPDLDVPATTPTPATATPVSGVATGEPSGNQLPDSDALQHEAEPPAVAE